jgi:glutamate--cysteine ligase
VTLDRSARSELDRPIHGVPDLVTYFESGEKAASAWRLGVENEKLSLGPTFRPVAYEGPSGIAAVLRALVSSSGWAAVEEDGKLIALEGGNASITLEPGGQLELSGAPLATAHDTAREFRTHLALVKRVSQPFGISWLALGAQPLHETTELPRMPKKRYEIMREYLPTRGSLALDMMHATASVQASFDYADEADMVSKMRTALGVTPIVGALYANSSLACGKASGFVSRRMNIWRNTDPDRCGGLPFVFEPDFGYARYAEWALDVPMFFIVRDGQYFPLRGVTFRSFLRDGYEGLRATLADFDRHLTTLFPDVRLKRLIEVRVVDAVPTDLLCSVPALWKGLLYDAQARQAAFDLVREWGPAEREQAFEAVSRRGLRARLNGRAIAELARELVSIASEGLRRIGHRDTAGQDEGMLLDALRAQLERGKSPGEILVERWEGEWERSPERLIENVRY